MTKEEFDKSLTKLVASMIEMNYSQETIDRALLWLAISRKEVLEKAITIVQEKLNKKPDEEEFDFWIGEFCNKICIHNSKEERKKIMDDRKKRI